ncbi:hypothetical protein P8452_64593 [Trifolium repens]|nr:hypothetical protein P8452_64593 [Trifolium repens]
MPPCLKFSNLLIDVGFGMETWETKEYNIMYEIEIGDFVNPNKLHSSSISILRMVPNLHRSLFALIQLISMINKNNF